MAKFTYDNAAVVAMMKKNRRTKALQISKLPSDAREGIEAWRLQVREFALAAVSSDGVIGDPELFYKAVTRGGNTMYPCLERIGAPKPPEFVTRRTLELEIRVLDRRILAVSARVNKPLSMSEDRFEKFINGEAV